MADNKEDIIYCPACGQEMQKIYLPEQKIHLDVCTDGCGGIYFDNRELDKIDELHEDISPLAKVFEGKEFKKVDEVYDRICPVCGWKMVKNFSSSKHQIQVDECYGCGGKFLDYSELEKIRDEYQTEDERAGEVIYDLYAAVGNDIERLDYIYNREMNRPSILTRLIKFKYKK